MKDGRFSQFGRSAGMDPSPVPIHRDADLFGEVKGIINARYNDVRSSVLWKLP